MDTPHGNQDISTLSRLLKSVDGIWSWEYDTKGNLLESNCPREALFATVLSVFADTDRLFNTSSRLASNDHDTWRPFSLGSAIGLLWGAAYELKDGEPYSIHLIGPVFYTDVSTVSVEQVLKTASDPSLSPSWIRRFIEASLSIPVIPHIVFARYLLMLHNSLRGEGLQFNDLSQIEEPLISEFPSLKRDRRKTYLYEQNMLQMVRDGNLNYADAFGKSAMISNGVPLNSSDPLRHFKTSVVVFTSLVCRAAIEGGISPEEAYSLGDSYIQATENAKTYDDLSALSVKMYDDFIRRVHKQKLNPAFSSAIRRSVEYIGTHLGENIRASDLAREVGYSEYYLTHKFKAETQLSLNDYIMSERIKRAKNMLSLSDRSIQEISDRLGFSNRNYFSRCFKRVTGLSPGVYRENPDLKNP